MKACRRVVLVFFQAVLFRSQIEGLPPGNYVFAAVVSFAKFLELIEIIRGPVAQWPGVEEEGG